ncbi:MAG: hypothetical protein PQ612_06405 [Rickettsiales bacterium]|nr:hypothetical protein [Pseudomonadota bacterium]MDA0966604.1 hypothetical protein [Pseudomonadota bacterium]MDG4543632.1 hypothetical protein [Rickettsiales bacterium]MDG4545779.1 hypothetical protein [Rickettsiales bacterium]MDG4547447.1 hypothetical protein [Rickettsiales bacterium]
MSDKFNFDDLGKEAARNEPPRSSDETVQKVCVQQYTPEEESEGVKFEFQANFVASSVVEGFASLWRAAWGASKGAELTEKEREGLNSLLDRGAEHFGFTTYISGGKGFFVELLGRILAAIVPRAANSTTRNHFRDTVFYGKKTDKKTENTQEKNDDEPISRGDKPAATADYGNGLTASNFSQL